MSQIWQKCVSFHSFFRQCSGTMFLQILWNVYGLTKHWTLSKMQHHKHEKVVFAGLWSMPSGTWRTSFTSLFMCFLSFYLTLWCIFSKCTNFHVNYDTVCVWPDLQASLSLFDFSEKKNKGWFTTQRKPQRLSLSPTYTGINRIIAENLQKKQNSSA